MTTINLTIASPVSASRVTYLRPFTMSRDALDDYFLNNEDYICNWLYPTTVDIMVDGEVRRAIYAGTAGGRIDSQDYFYLPEGDAWAAANRGEGEAQIIGHAMITNRARYGLMMAANW